MVLSWSFVVCLEIIVIVGCMQTQMYNFIVVACVLSANLVEDKPKPVKVVVDFMLSCLSRYHKNKAQRP